MGKKQKKKKTTGRFGKIFRHKTRMGKTGTGRFRSKQRLGEKGKKVLFKGGGNNRGMDQIDGLGLHVTEKGNSTLTINWAGKKRTAPYSCRWGDWPRGQGQGDEKFQQKQGTMENQRRARVTLRGR